MDTSKIIKGVVNSGRYTVTAPIVKEDYGLYLQIEGVELPQTYEVDFSNSENSGTSVTMIGNSDGVLIPHQFIETGKDVFAFLYHVGEDFGRTVYKFRIPNKVRPDRTNEEPTPEEQSVIDQAISALNEAVAQTAQDVIDADASAQSASADADRAEEARTDAQNYATQAEQARDDAQTYANNASASATASAQSASQSAQIKADVEDLADDAQGYAQASERSASASANSASQAQGFAQSASASAQSASGYASSAQTSAQTASTKAQDASQSASTASQKATESAQSASQALSYKTDAESAKTASQTAQGLAESARDSAISAKNDAESAKDDAESARDEAQSIVDGISGALDDKAPVITDTASGSIASFSDGADDLPLKSLVVDINPVQDLHGQDAPYPAGGGKNLINQSDIASTSATTTISANVASGETYTLSAICSPESQSARVRISYILNGETVWTFGNQIIAPTSAVSSATVTVPDGVTELSLSFQPLNSGRSAYSKIQLEKGATATSYAPYENICPISGWTEVDVEQSGVNVWDEEWEVGSINISQGINTSDNTRIRSKNFISVKPNTTYYFKAPNTLGIRYYDLQKQFISYTTVQNKTLTMPDKAYYVRFTVVDTTTYSNDISINYPSTDHEYHPYTGRSITISLGQTVYGGKLDVLSGVLTVDRVMRVFDGTESEWQWFEGYKQASVSLTETAKYNASKLTYICNVLNPVVNQSRPANIGNFASLVRNGASAAFSAPSNTLDEFKAFAQANPIQFCYELATTITVQLTPNQVNSLLGQNNIWADSGDTEIEYRADTKLFIERLTAPDSADMIADANITSGKYFMVGNTLYKATANIANGGQIIVGTNCTRVSLAQALNEINV